MRFLNSSTGAFEKKKKKRNVISGISFIKISHYNEYSFIIVMLILKIKIMDKIFQRMKIILLLCTKEKMKGMDEWALSLTIIT